ncbi:membrane protein [Streptomyces sp. NRRL B-3648]|nr:membrane protein [Streptomyces sp. NRRL B-3648]
MPPQARRRPGGGRRPPRPVAGVRPGPALRLPDPRLTGLGSGLFCAAAMFLLGYLDQLLFGASLTVYGVLFLPVCVLTALWVRAGDVLTAPVVAPIAFAVGLLPVADGGGGLLGRMMGLVTGLATQAGWLYGGTLAAGLIVLVRRVRWVQRRRRRG